MSDIPAFPVDTRSRRDLVTNPAFGDLLSEMDQMIQQETATLTNDAKDTDIGRVNYQAGVLEGIRRAQVRLANYREHALYEFGKVRKEQP
jgi:hypothetical protein